MPLNKRGIAQLKRDLRKNAKHYDQNTFGRVTTECGTECCMAGLCHVRKIGLDSYTRQINRDARHAFYYVAALCSGIKQLGIRPLQLPSNEWRDMPEIFRAAHFWPHDLAKKYRRADLSHDHAAMAEIACEALDRLNEDGSIRDK